MDSYNNCLRIRREALQANARAVMDYMSVPVIGVVKMDGYGMGVVEAAKIWLDAGVTMLAVAEPWEALALREAGIDTDILLMAPVADRDIFAGLLQNGVIFTVSDLNTAKFYLENAQRQPLRAHVKVDTGMGRFGVRWTDIPQLKDIYALEGIRFEGIFSHLGKSFEDTFDVSKVQLERFLGAVQALQDTGIQVGMRHIANSCAALRFPQTHLDAVRMGSALVGALMAKVPVKLESPHTFRARVVAVKDLKAGDTSGYACVYKVKKDTRAMVVGIGTDYGFGMTGAPDPYPVRDLLSYLYHLYLRWKNPPYAVFEGKRLPLIGRIGSQYTTFDATGSDVKPGDWVEVPMSLLNYHGKRIIE